MRPGRVDGQRTFDLVNVYRRCLNHPMRNPPSMRFWKTIGQLRGDLVAYACSISDSLDEAEDLVSDAIERAAKAKTRPKSPDDLRPWMFRVIRNLSVDELRKRRVRREYSASVARFEGTSAWARSCIEDQIFIREAFNALGSKQREVLFLVDVMGMTYIEAAEVMDVPTGTVMSRVSRARKALLSLVDADQVVPFRKGTKHG